MKTGEASAASRIEISHISVQIAGAVSISVQNIMPLESR